MKKITFVLLLAISGLTTAFGQTYKMSNGTINVNGSGNFYDAGGAGSNHGSNKNFTQTFKAPAGQYLTFTFTEFDLGTNDYLYIYDGSSTSARLIDVYARTSSPGKITTSEAGGSLTFSFTSDNSSAANGTGWAARYGTGGPNQIMTGETCGNAAPFCTNTGASFPNNTNQPSLGSGGIYGCLGSTPNPVWYYLQIANPGTINITINQQTSGGSPIDVDFILWGPFTSVAQGCGALSTSNDIDCSYSSSATEYADIPNAQTGQIYILLLTNYSNAAGNITFNQSGGSGSTNCGILCSTLSNTGPVCTTSTFNLTATPVNGATAYNWTGPNGFSSSSQNPTGVVPPPTTGSNTYPYTLVVTTPTGTCTATTTVTVRETPVVNAGTTTTITCAQQTAILDASSTVSGSTIVWNGPNASNASDPYTAIAAGTYTATATANSCSSTATISVTTNTTAPVPSYTTPDGTVLNCNIQAVTLNGSATPPGATVVWAGLAGNPVSVSAAGTYTLTATDPSNGCSANTTVTVTANAGPPNISVTNSPNTTIISCIDSAIVLAGHTTTPNTVGGWSGPSGGLVGDTITVTSPGVYTYQVTDNNNGCQSSSTVNITRDTAAPNIQISAPVTLITCAQTSVSLIGSSSTGNTSLAWSEDSVAIAGNPIAVTDSGTYVLVVTNNTNGCTSTMSQQVTKDVLVPNVGITAPNTVLNCMVSSIPLLGTSTTGGVTFAWDGATGASSSNPLTTSTSGAYTVTVTNPSNGCISTQTITITEDVTPPGVGFTTPQGTVIDCGTPQVSLSGNSPLGTATLVWTGSSGTLSGNPATVGSPDTYTITATNPANGCSSYSTVVVTSNGALPNISYTTSAPNITCSTTSITLTGASITPNVSIVWSDASGPVSGNNPVTVNAAGSYTLTVTDLGSNCASTTSALIGTDTIHPNLNILPSTSTLTCATTIANLSGTSTTPGATFSWSGPSGALAGNPVGVSTAGTYSLTVTNPNNGCTRSQTFTLGSNTTAPTVNLSSSTTILNCTTPIIPITATGSPATVTYSWSGMGSGSNPTLNASVPGNFVMTVTDPTNGCTASSNVTLTQNITQPNVFAGNDAQLNCNGNPITLDGSSSTPNVLYSWSGPALFSSTQQDTATTVAGTFTLTVTDPANGCTASDIVSALPNTQVPNVNAGLNQNIKCNKPTVQLTGSSNTPNATFLWTGPGSVQPNNTTAICTTAVAGTYTLTVTNPATGCVSTDQVLVTSTPAPNAGFTATPVEGYVPLTVTFSNTSTNSNNYSWNFDNQGIATTTTNAPTPAVASTANPSTIYNESGTYQVMMITSISGNCKDTAYITIEVKDITEVVIPNIFSPNADGQNDFFEPATLKAVAELTIDVWDRWGKHVKTFDGLHGHWDGNGSSDGTYFYIAKGMGRDKSEIEQTGFVTLVRAK